MNKVPKALAVSVAIACLVVIWSEWTRNPSPLPDSQWQQMADYLKKHAIKDTIVLNNGGSTEGLKTLQSAGLKVRLALPEPRGRIRRLWVVGRHPYRAQGHDKLGPNELPKESVPKGFYLDHFCAALGAFSGTLATSFSAHKSLRRTSLVPNHTAEVSAAPISRTGCTSAQHNSPDQTPPTIACGRTHLRVTDR